LYGTLTTLMPAASRNSSTLSENEPVAPPPEAKVSLPGFLFA
jgi:hypothetical protein